MFGDKSYMDYFEKVLGLQDKLVALTEIKTNSFGEKIMVIKGSDSTLSQVFSYISMDMKLSEISKKYKININILTELVVVLEELFNLPSQEEDNDIINDEYMN